MFFLYIRNMNKFTFTASVCVAFFFAACGDDGGSATRPSEESSSSVALSSSSSSVIPSSSSSKVTESAEVTKGSITDTRDGHSYKTVTIGSQTWMAQNLNYETVNSYCYSDNASNCTKYGRLYTWAAAMDSVGSWSANGKGCGYGKTCSPTYPVRGVCPEGWHLPTQTEWNKKSSLSWLCLSLYSTATSTSLSIVLFLSALAISGNERSHEVSQFGITCG